MSNHNTATFRKLGESTKDVSGKIGNAILDFDWTPVLDSIVILALGYGFIMICFGCYKKIIRDINNWKSYHISQKIMYLTFHLTMFFLICFFIWIFLFV